MRPRSSIGLSLALVMLLGAVGTPAVQARTPHGQGRSHAVKPAKPPRRLALGVSIPDGRDLSKLDAFRASIGGRRVATWTVWSQWGKPSTAAFPSETAEGIRQRGAVPMIWWEPISPDDWSDPTYTRNLTIADGTHDAYIREFADAAKAYGGTVLLRFAHQPNSNYLPWGWDYRSTDDNTITTFKQMWRHVVRVFRAEGAWNVKFLWSMATQTCNGNCLTRPVGYPGDRWVDYLAFTWENWGEAPPGSAVPSRPTISMLDGYRPIVRRLKQVSDKPIIAVATASSPDGGIQARWIHDGYRQVYRWLPRIVAIMYLDVDLSGAPSYHRDWSMSPESLAEYAAIAALPRFQGRIRR